MSRARVVRLLLTLLVLGVWVGFLFRGYGGTWGVTDSPVPGHPHQGTLVPDAFFATHLPPGVEAGDRFDRRQLTHRERVGLLMTRPDVGERLSLTLERGGERRDVVLVATPAGEMRAIDWLLVAAQLLYTILGLLLLWRGRDWTAWGLATFALGFGLKDLFAYAVPLEAAGWVIVFMRGVRDIGLYVAARTVVREHLSGRAARASLWAMLVVVAAYLALMAHAYLSYLLAARYATGSAVAGELLMELAAAVCVLTMAAGYRRADAVRRLQIRWILVGMLVHTVAFVVWGLVPEVLAISLALTALACFMYATLRHRLVDLSFAISRTLVYATVVALVVGVFAIIEQALAAQVLGPGASMVLHLLVPLVLGISLHKLRERIEHWIGRLFFRRRYEAERALQRIARESAYIEKESALLSRALAGIMRHVEPTGAAIYQRGNRGYELSTHSGQGRWPERIDADDPAFIALRAGADEARLPDLGSALGANGIAFPMSVAGTLRGAIVCGDRAQQYTADERRLLASLTHEVGVALTSLKARDSERLLEALARGAISVRDVREHVQGA